MSTVRTSGRRWTFTLATGACVLFAARLWAGDVEPPPPILPPGGPRAATDLRALIDCSPSDRRPLVRLQWTRAQTAGQLQRVDFTIYREGFLTGQFESSSSLPSEQASFVIEEGVNTERAATGPGLTRWRVLTLHDDGFVPSETERFSAPICVKDESDSGPVIP
jgi:hypothetical protein